MPQQVLYQTTTLTGACVGIGEDVSKIELTDPHRLHRYPAARGAKENPVTWIGQRQFYSGDASEPRFASVSARSLETIWGQGSVKALEQ